jgi:hypothetical protein
MKLWKRAVGALKDQNSVWIAGLSRRTRLRHPEIEAAVVRATSHHEYSLNRRNIERASEWMRISSSNVKPFLWSISQRMEKTQSWVVALKGLYLMHHVITSNMACVRKMGRLPFDLSNFKDGHFPAARSWPFDEFIHAYYAFLDQKSVILYECTQEKKEDIPISQELDLIQKMQGLIDLLIQVKPQGAAAYAPLVLDVMEGIAIEINNNYNIMCGGIAHVLMNIYSSGKAEATMALDAVRKAALQGEELAFYFEICREIGIVNGSKCSFADRIPEEGILELERIVKEIRDGANQDENQEKAIVVRDDQADEKDDRNNECRTIITDHWEKFEDDFVQRNPFVSPQRMIGYHTTQDELPDLITF